MGLLRPQLPEGILCFIGTDHWLGEQSPDGVELVLAEGVEPWDILRRARTEAPNYDMNTEDLIRELQAFYEEAPFTIHQTTTDKVVWELDRLPRGIPVYCEKLYELCPDIVDQGVGRVEELAPLVEVGWVYLWWD